MTRNLRIIHVLRAPVGGLFRHVVDLAIEQANVGHEVGVIYDRSTQSPEIQPQIDLLHQNCRLGVRATKMPRVINIYDFTALRAVSDFALKTGAQILHGHGAKGGAYARYAAGRIRTSRHPLLGFYTPHGGSLHYSPKTIAGRIFLGLERWLAKQTSGLIFESSYSAGIYQSVVGGGVCPQRVIPNGLRPEEFERPTLVAEPADFLFVGELRFLKGVDVLLHALKGLMVERPDVRLAVVGDGPDLRMFQSLVSKLGLTANVTFFGRLPARQAFTLGRAIVVPSRAESFPYIVLEAGAAQIPLIATDVGGIHEITDGTPVSLIASNDVGALVTKMNDFLQRPEIFHAKAQALAAQIQLKFNVEIMASQITDFYLSVLKR